MIRQKCALCQKDDFRILYKANFDIKQIDEKIFSARRLPDRLHYRIVQCRKCRVVYSNPILDHTILEKLYKKSVLVYDEHIANLQKTYGFYLRKLEKFAVRKSRILEIGCGNGFFLEEARAQGYKEVYGVEPSMQAVSKASSYLKKRIKIDIFRHGLYARQFFDVICCFQTLDHLPDPNAVLRECFFVLKKGGLVLFLNHDVESLSARLLKNRSPIIDIEHTYLFSKKTMRQLFEKHGFQVLAVENSFNFHNISYWVRLFPFPNWLKLRLIDMIKMLKLDAFPLKLYPGNLVLFGRK